MVKVGMVVEFESAETGMKPENEPCCAVPGGASEMGVQPLAKNPCETVWFFG